MSHFAASLGSPARSSRSLGPLARVRHLSIPSTDATPALVPLLSQKVGEEGTYANWVSGQSGHKLEELGRALAAPARPPA